MTCAERRAVCILRIPGISALPEAGPSSRGMDPIRAAIKVHAHPGRGFPRLRFGD